VTTQGGLRLHKLKNDAKSAEKMQGLKDAYSSFALNCEVIATTSRRGASNVADRTGAKP
jgi:hypothetical protein